eukprot:NODE_1327_length_562_cov_24.988304_g1252_i0.p1 GENE.NODE_1327_length_562_cov_24.988304_g1252_i0~~NODE_1327_length_562_cov_24.988304_g1252_i0.p1  ORF type:complete len:117 (-),score=39.79 NODE_1327_length_562_cov_24.988304_g1252_i0:212-532(-)
MGLKNAPAAFQRMINEKLDGVSIPGRMSAQAYIDDVIVSSKATPGQDKLEAHKIALDRTFQALMKAGLKVEMDKAQIAYDTVEFCGHIISQGQRRPAPGKVQALKA